MGMSPIVARLDNLSFGWFSNEGCEPAHVHVFHGSDRKTSLKFWLKESGAELAKENHSFSSKEVRIAKEFIDTNLESFSARWLWFFSSAESHSVNNDGTNTSSPSVSSEGNSE